MFFYFLLPKIYWKSNTINIFPSQISSQHPYAEEFIGRPHVWTVDMANRTDVREALKAILSTKVVSR